MKIIKTIYVICNSAEALRIISSGAYPDLHKADLFTCNNAFTFFRTEGRHLNFFTDTMDIIRHLKMPETLSDGYEKKVEHIYSRKGCTMQSGENLFSGLKHFSPIQNIGSSGLNALVYAAVLEKPEEIYFIGYTLDESANPIWKFISESYDPPRLGPGGVWYYRRKKNS